MLDESYVERAFGAPIVANPIVDHEVEKELDGETKPIVRTVDDRMHEPKDALYVESISPTILSTVVSAIQYKPMLLNVQENLKTALALTYESALKGARVIVLPELSLSGFVINNVNEAIDVCQQKNGYQSEAFLPIARSLNCHIVLGYVELNDGKLYNSAVVIGPSGVVENVQKHNLYGSDNLWATPSESVHGVVVTSAGRLGTLICRDLSNNYRESYSFYRPEHKFYNKGSVDTIALLTNWGSGYSYPDNAWVELSEKLDVNVIVSNRVGKERDMTYKGGSAIIGRGRRIWTNGSSFTDNAVVGGIITP